MTDPRPPTRPDLLAAGISDDHIRAAVRAGDLVPLTRGLYLSRADHDRLDAPGRHRMRARHVASKLSPGTVISHVSAATLLNLDVWNIDLDRVHVSRAGPHGRRTTHLHVHATTWTDGDVAAVDGVAVTSPARTVVDLARSRCRDQAVVVGDSALRTNPATSDLLPDTLAAARHRNGTVRAAAVVSFLDALSESPGESSSRVRIAETGLPRPVLQHPIVVRDGRRFRLDFFWGQHGLVGEFDGTGKYVDRRDLVAEKLREDAVRDLRLEVIRWTWADPARFDVVARRFERAAARRSTR
ncbi:type IV toxin-antitoxin system AbiEi family antitoxin domain-containing protein [Rhodococcus phenolicus]|uniref:type IV toxin-antitoxin system AbiEi family antitoxin domain-containing protein n=1 Tax=Rhodococcus phenolicus TaxID=263849 RepID=UPI0008351A31|nr:type IV toxin-antitoxin system AbiEi family antitoxin domain-containing protein [Rhodococcus phenolicus]